MKKSLILLLTLIMMISLVIISCNPDSSSGQAVAEEEKLTFTKTDYETIKEDNTKAVTTSINFSSIDFKNPESNLQKISKISGTLTMAAAKNGDEVVGFSLVSEEDLKKATPANTDEKTTNSAEVSPNTYSKIVVEVTYDSNKTSDNKGFSGKVAYNLAGDKKLDSDKEITLTDFMSTTDDDLVKEVQILMSKAMSSDEGEGDSTNPTLELNFNDYLDQIIAIGSAAPTVSLEVTITPTGENADAIKIALKDAVLGGDTEKETLIFGGTIAISQVVASTQEGSTPTEINILSLGGKVSLAFDDFNCTIGKDEEGELKIDEPTGSIGFGVTDIKLALGSEDTDKDNYIEITGSIAGTIDEYGLNKVACDFTEKIGGKDYLATTFTIDRSLAKDGGFFDALTITKFKLGDSSYSGESVKAVLKKVAEEKKKSTY